MVEGFGGPVGDFSDDPDEMAIRGLIEGLQGGETDLPERVQLNLREAATMAYYHGRRMKLKSRDAFDALAALCLVLGNRRINFFENVFVNRMIANRELSARQKLNRLIEIIIGTIPRPEPCDLNDNSRLETA